MFHFCLVHVIVADEQADMLPAMPTWPDRLR
jgi:hypothetical protein